MSDNTQRRRVAIVMAGGSGERFWPLSRRLRPKQLLYLAGGEGSLLDQTLQRMLPIIPPEDVFIVTGRDLVEPIRSAGANLPGGNVIAEPCKRNTAGCLVYATACLLANAAGPDTPVDSETLHRQLSVVVLPADPMISDVAGFQRTVRAALSAAEEESALALVAIRPSRPETGYGYVQIDEDSRANARKIDGVPVHPVLAFHEKPESAVAEVYAASGCHFWNAGMFFWPLDAFLRELRRAQPEMVQRLFEIADAIRRNDLAAVDTLFASLPNVSIDVALMEKAERVLALEAQFEWDDIGAWPALLRTMPRDEHGNVVVGEAVIADTRDCIVYNETGSKRMLTVVGAEGLVIVATGDSILVMPSASAQEVKQIVAKLRETRPDLL